MDKRKINIVLYETEIAQNMGSIMRTCVAINARLHVIEPTGFPMDDRHLSRPSANEYKFVDMIRYDDWSHFLELNPNQTLFCLSRYGSLPISKYDFNQINDDVFVMFGKESTGIPFDILKQHYQTTFRIPMIAEARSLNISNAVSIASYEILRQWDYLQLCKTEVQRGANYIVDELWKNKKG